MVKPIESDLKPGDILIVAKYTWILVKRTINDEPCSEHGMVVNQFYDLEGMDWFGISCVPGYEVPDHWIVYRDGVQISAGE